MYTAFPTEISPTKNMSLQDRVLSDLFCTPEYVLGKSLFDLHDVVAVKQSAIAALVKYYKPNFQEKMVQEGVKDKNAIESLKEIKMKILEKAEESWKKKVEGDVAIKKKKQGSVPAGHSVPPIERKLVFEDSEN
jgi:hypothetical protein